MFFFSSCEKGLNVKFEFPIIKHKFKWLSLNLKFREKFNLSNSIFLELHIIILEEFADNFWF